MQCLLGSNGVSEHWVNITPPFEQTGEEADAINWRKYIDEDKVAGVAGKGWKT
jgi:hypothetical protein